MSTLKPEEIDNPKEILVDTITTDLIRQFKVCIDEINTEIVVINDSYVEQ